MQNQPNPPVYCHFQDFVDAFVGPFDTEQAALEHAFWCKYTRNDGADLIALVPAPCGHFAENVMTPEEDRAYDCTSPFAYTTRI